jgi:hypothetical protein
MARALFPFAARPNYRLRISRTSVMEGVSLARQEDFLSPSFVSHRNNSQNSHHSHLFCPPSPSLHLVSSQIMLSRIPATHQYCLVSNCTLC